MAPTVERATPLEDLTTSFRVVTSTVEAGEFETRGLLVLDLDLDAGGGGGATMFLEDFESATLGSFEVMDLDAGIPGNSNAEGQANADGYRCQFTQPGWIPWYACAPEAPCSHSTGCFPGFSLLESNAVHWQIDGATVPLSPDGGRAFDGSHSLYYGVFLPAIGEFTTPTSALEAVRTSAPVNLGLGQPVLSFKHQVSLLDFRLGSGDFPWTAYDRAVVQLQVADAADAPVGSWITLEPFLNLYHGAFRHEEDTAVVLCGFDPVDDGNTEDDFFNPADPLRAHGPSSTCFRRTYTDIGSTAGAPGAGGVGSANEGPGLAGSLGDGTWVESAFDLARWRGRRVRIRFLVSALQGSAAPTWEGQIGLNPSPLDDGWWIDDVSITGAVTVEVTATAVAEASSQFPDTALPPRRRTNFRHAVSAVEADNYAARFS